jgi:hypothetical protein
MLALRHPSNGTLGYTADRVNMYRQVGAYTGQILKGGFPPGGGADITARLIGQWLSERLGQPFIIDNLPGAGSNIATEAVVRAPADGYTLLLVGAFNSANSALG